MSIPNPNPNIADGIKCDNKTYSSNKIESLIQTATELPIPEAGDVGKVLTVNADHDGYELDTPIDESDITSAITTALSDFDSVDITSDVTFIEGVTKNYGYVVRAGNVVQVNLVLEVTTNIANNSPILSGLPKAFKETRQLLGTNTTQYMPSNLTSQAAFVTVGSSSSGISIMGSITASAESKVYAFLYFTYLT